MSDAKMFLAENPTDVSDLMGRLNSRGLPADQDWEEGATSWEFPDGSRVVISGTDVIATGGGDGE